MLRDYNKTEDGLELVFGCNHIGHFLFTNLIVNKILTAGPGARIVTVSSNSHWLSTIRWDDWGFQVIHPCGLSIAYDSN